MAASAVIGGVLLALIEGMGILFMRYTSDQFKPLSPLEDPQQLQDISNTSGLGGVNSSSTPASSFFSNSPPQGRTIEEIN